jgi:hypothetical protein
MSLSNIKSCTIRMEINTQGMRANSCAPDQAPEVRTRLLNWSKPELTKEQHDLKLERAQKLRDRRLVKLHEKLIIRDQLVEKRRRAK